MGKRRKIAGWTLGVLGAGVAATGLYTYHVYSAMEQTLHAVHEPVQREAAAELRPEPVVVQRQDPISVLVLGVDERAGDKGRTDSLLLVTMNPAEATTKVVSIPRDSYADIAGKSKKDKINHAYAYGGVAATMSTVEQFLNVPIDYYVQVNMDGFRDIVDAVGGITVNNAFPFSYEGSTFAKGAIQLNGEEALRYARMRKEDPNGDFGRQERQRQVLEAVLQKGANFSSLANVDKVLAAVQKNVRTNLTAADMYTIQRDYRQAAGSIEQVQMPGDGRMQGRVWYYMVPAEARQQLSQQLRRHLHM